MDTFHHINDLQQYLNSIREQGLRIGFVPTMGALHRGHASLIETAKQQTDYVVCSIFVNPTQFNNPKDLEHYPRTLPQDLALLLDLGCDAVFLPSVEEMYPPREATHKLYHFGSLEDVMEGAFRPGHFQGVATIVEKLLRCVEPHALFMGQKDFQQCAIVASLIQQMDWSEKVQLVVCPTLREEDGLAMSSRNVRLNDEARKQALSISKALFFAQKNYQDFEIQALKKHLKDELNQNNLVRVEYVEVVDALNLQPIEAWNEARRIVMCIAANVDNTRLIDNVLLVN